MKKTFIILMITSFLYSCSDSYTDGDLLEEKRGLAYIDNEAGEKVKFSGTAIWELDNDNKRIISYEEGIRQTLEEGISNEKGFSGLKVNYFRNKKNYLASDFYKGMQANAILSKAYFKNDLLDGECVDYPVPWWGAKPGGYKITFNYKEGKRNGNSYAITKEGVSYTSSLKRKGRNGNEMEWLKKVKDKNMSGINVVVDKPFIVSSVDWLDGKLHGEAFRHVLRSTTHPGTLVYKGKFEKGCPIGKHVFYVDGDYETTRDTYKSYEYQLFHQKGGKRYEVDFKECKESAEKIYVLDESRKISGQNSVTKELTYDQEGFLERKKECKYFGVDCKTKTYFQGVPCDNEGDLSCKQLKEGLFEADTSLQRKEQSYGRNLKESDSICSSSTPINLWEGNEYLCNEIMRSHVGLYEVMASDYAGPDVVFASKGFCK